jgi:site-specific DNA-adenine methylase
MTIKSPYPYFGSKQKVAPIIWQAFGEISNYVEPFAGSLAVLLANPNVPKIETINDINCFLINFWRAVSNDPDGVAKFADYPVTQIDLHARHKWLVENLTDEFKNKMESDPNFYDLKIAGYWIWGMGASIGDNWLKPKGLSALPFLSCAGSGIHGMTYTPLEWFKKLQERTRRVRMCCTDWTKLVTPSVTYNNNGISPKDITAILLDPPYLYKGRDKVYTNEADVFKDVCKWAIDNGNNPKLRIAVCGYDGDYIFPDNWKTYNWQTLGGMGNLGNDRGKANSKREIIWFNQYCLDIKLKII